METCSIESCARRIKARGWCKYHYEKWRKYGDPLYVKPPKQLKHCPVEDCPKDEYRKGYCYAHYMKVWRYGTPTPEFEPKWTDLRGQRFGTLTVTKERVDRFWVCKCDCGETAHRTTNALEQFGDSNTCGVPGKHYRVDDPVYNSAHDRVRYLYGKASDHACTDCGQPAHHWAYDHTDPDELLYEYAPGRYAAYSRNPEHYTPRCVPCHKRFDLDRINSTSGALDNMSSFA